MRLDFGLIVGRLADVAEAVIAGRVTTGSGRGLGRVEVRVQNVLESSVHETVRTDDYGWFKIELREFGQYYVLVHGPGYVAHSEVIFVTPNLRGTRRRMDFELGEVHLP